ncbi:MAG TPA: hypothetical protein VF774_03030 [Pseudoduganella sp.]|jgi:hypothetical protein
MRASLKRSSFVSGKLPPTVVLQKYSGGEAIVMAAMIRSPQSEAIGKVPASSPAGKVPPCCTSGRITRHADADRAGRDRCSVSAPGAPQGNAGPWVLMMMRLIINKISYLQS